MARAYRFLDPLLALKRRLAKRAGKPDGVLLLSCGGLGDTVLFSLVLPRFMELAQPGETVTVLLRRNAAKMAFLFPAEVMVEIVDFDRLAKDLPYRARVLGELFRSHYRQVVATDYLRHPFLDEALIAACVAPETAAMEPRPWRKYDHALARNRALYQRLFDSGAIHQDKVVRWARFADWLTGRTAPPPRVRLPEETLPPMSKEDPPSVLIQAFSAVKRKQPSVDLFRAILDALPRTHHVAFLGAPGDLDRNPEFKTLLERGNVSFDSSVFAEIVPRLRGASLVISVDTALMHLAVAVGARTLCLASAAYVGEIVPYDPAIAPENMDVLYTAMDCEGCLGDCIHEPVNGMYPCVARLDRERVLETVGRLLDAG